MTTLPTLPKYAFFEGEIVPFSEAKVSVMTHTFNYGTGAFGGVRAYWNDDDRQLHIFRPLDHFKRLLGSAKMLLMSLPYTPEDLTRILVDLLRAENRHEDMYVRPLVYKSDPLIGVRLHDLSEQITMFTIPFGRYIEQEEGAHVGFSSWRRIDDNTIPARGKIVGAYANSAFIKTEAMLNGFDDALVLNEDGHVSEGSAANLFIVRDGVAITPPITSNILEGITRKTIIQLLRDEMDMEVQEREVDKTELYLAEEAFLCGTGVQVCAISRVDHRPVGTGVIGPVVKTLRDLYFKLVRGCCRATRRG
ncbi:MAG: branched-chain amino acid transaminase [Anaerolineae bacterium]|nr:branched-chain amino acid transaminase [Anaerolineae bacterium]